MTFTVDIIEFKSVDSNDPFIKVVSNKDCSYSIPKIPKYGESASSETYLSGTLTANSVKTVTLTGLDNSNYKSVIMSFTDGTNTVNLTLPAFTVGGSNLDKQGLLSSITTTTTDGSYKNEDEINITLNFSKVVRLKRSNENSSGSMVVKFNSGGEITFAAKAQSADTADDNIWAMSSKTFKYTIGASDSANRLNVSAITFNNALLWDNTENSNRNFQTNVGGVNIPSLSNGSSSNTNIRSIKVDNTAPTIVTDNGWNGHRTRNLTDSNFTNVKSGDRVLAEIQLNEACQEPVIKLKIGTDGTEFSPDSYESNTAKSIWRGKYLFDDDDTEGDIYYKFVDVKDLAGNAITNPAVDWSKGIAFDKTAPTLTSITTTTANGSYKNGDSNIPIKLTFSENVDLASNNMEITLNTTPAEKLTIAPADLTDADSVTVNYVIGATNNVVGLDISKVELVSTATLKDAAGNSIANTTNITIGTNLASSSTINIDNTAPTISTALAVDNSNVASITFSEPVFQSDGNTLTDTQLVANISDGTATGSYTVATSDNETFTFNPSLNDISDGYESLNIVGTVYDAAGNSLAVNVNVFLKDNTAPTNQDTVFGNADLIKKTSDGTIAITSSGDASNQVWLAPLGTTTFGISWVTDNMTQAAGDSTSINIPADEGVYYLYVIDKSENVSSNSSNKLTVDNTGPIITITKLPNNKFYPSVTFKTNKDCTYTVSNDGNFFLKNGTINSNTELTIKLYELLDNGAYDAIIISVTDSAGNTKDEIIGFTVNKFIIPIIIALLVIGLIIYYFIYSRNKKKKLIKESANMYNEVNDLRDRMNNLKSRYKNLK